jgi:hypothetical protein
MSVSCFPGARKICRKNFVPFQSGMRISGRSYRGHLHVQPDRGWWQAVLTPVAKALLPAPLFQRGWDAVSHQGRPHCANSAQARNRVVSPLLLLAPHPSGYETAPLTTTIVPITEPAPVPPTPPATPAVMTYSPGSTCCSPTESTRANAAPRASTKPCAFRRDAPTTRARSHRAWDFVLMRLSHQHIVAAGAWDCLPAVRIC